MRLPVIRALEVCPVEVAVSVLGGTWKLTLVKHLLDGPRRFNELGRLVPSANTKTLTRQLRELESDGVVHRTVFAEVPPRVEYRLTRLGRTLEPVVEVMDRWGGGVRRGLHPGCGGDRPLRESVARGGVEPPTFRFSGGRSYQLSYLAPASGTPEIQRVERPRRDSNPRPSP